MDNPRDSLIIRIEALLTRCNNLTEKDISIIEGLCGKALTMGDDYIAEKLLDYHKVIQRVRTLRSESKKRDVVQPLLQNLRSAKRHLVTMQTRENNG